MGQKSKCGLAGLWALLRLLSKCWQCFWQFLGRIHFQAHSVGCYQELFFSKAEVLHTLVSLLAITRELHLFGGATCSNNMLLQVNKPTHCRHLEEISMLNCIWPIDLVVSSSLNSFINSNRFLLNIVYVCLGGGNHIVKENGALTDNLAIISSCIKWDGKTTHFIIAMKIKCINPS